MNGKPHIAFVIHGKIRAKEKLVVQATSYFQDLGTLEFLITQADKNARLCATEAIDKGATILIAVGGDGTVNEVANAILFHPSRRHLKMGILPYGKGNDFVRSLGIGRDLTVLRDKIKLGKSRHIDVGNMEYRTTNAEISHRYFVNITDVGLGGLATQMLRTGRPLWSASLTYFLVIVRSFLKYKLSEVKFLSDAISFESPAMSICMANGKYFASGLGIAPDAQMDDGMLDWVILGRISVWDYIKNIPKLKKAKRISHPEVFYHRGAECTIESQTPLPIDMDGEFIGYTPLRCRIRPRALEILV